MDTFSEIIHDLQVLPCLAGLSSEDLAAIGRMTNFRKIRKNEVLFEETEAVQYFFIVRAGSVKLSKNSQEGKELIVKIMGPGDYLCCAPLYAGGRHFMSAVAREDSALLAIPAVSFKEFLSGSLGPMGLKIIGGLCGRISYLSNLMEDLTFKDVEQRVMLALMRLAEEKSPSDRMTALTVTHQDIASMTGTVREVVSRTMSRLKKEHVVTDSSAKGFTVDKERLLWHLFKKYPHISLTSQLQTLS